MITLFFGKLSQYTAGRATTNFEDLRQSHVQHISADVISFSELERDTVFIGDLSADCVFLYNTGFVRFDIHSNHFLVLASTSFQIISLCMIACFSYTNHVEWFSVKNDCLLGACCMKI